MLYLKPANFEDLDAEYEYVKEMPIDENGLTNEYFVSFKDYPDFYTATVQQINDFTVDAFGNFHWEVLDIDIEKESLETPENYPLVFTK